jgi:predicted Zn-dependent peptidase
MRRLLRGILLLLGSAITAAGSVMAGEYSPPGLYDVEHRVLANGLRVILKPRHGAHTVAFRVVVGVGQHDFACGWQETPHFLEHLLFTGTSRYTEAGLDELIEQHGGDWNAYTYAEDTVYTLDIYGKYALLGLDVLHQIMTDSLLSAEDVETSRGIVEREAGGRPSAIQQWMRRKGVGWNATDKALRQVLPGSNYICNEYESAESITREHIIEAFRSYYVPGNMALVVVGDFDTETMNGAIRDTFGTIPAQPVPERHIPVPPPPRTFTAVKSTASPVLGTGAEIGMVFRAVGMTSPDYYPFYVLAEYLGTRLYETIRVDSGLSYAPVSELGSLLDYGVFIAYADVELDMQDRALELLRTEIRRLQEPLDAGAVELARRKLLLRMAQGYESNSELADYYADSVFEYRTGGALVDQEARIEAITAADLHRVATQYLRPDQAVEFREVPTLTYAEFYMGLVLLAILAVAVLAALVHRRLRRQGGDLP